VAVEVVGVGEVGREERRERGDVGREREERGEVVRDEGEALRDRISGYRSMAAKGCVWIGGVRDRTTCCCELCQLIYVQ